MSSEERMTAEQKARQWAARKLAAHSSAVHCACELCNVARQLTAAMEARDTATENHKYAHLNWMTAERLGAEWCDKHGELESALLAAATERTEELYARASFPEQQRDALRIAADKALGLLRQAESKLAHIAPALPVLKTMCEAAGLQVGADKAAEMIAAITPGLIMPGSVEYRQSSDAATARERALRGALQQASNDLRTVGDDYPGSSCHLWCHTRADAADSALLAAHPPSAPEERTVEENLAQFAADLAAKQTPLDADVRAMLYENLWELYGDGKPPSAGTEPPDPSKCDHDARCCVRQFPAVQL